MIKPGGEQAPASAWRIDFLLALIVVLTCVLSISHHNADPDLWGHVAYGSDLLRDGLPSTITYSYNAPGHPWINHENLAELLFAVGLTMIGVPFMLSLKCLMGAAAFALMYRQARRRGVGQFASLAALLFAASNLMHFWVMRPQLLTYFFFALMIAGLGWCFEGWEGRGTLPWSRRAGDSTNPAIVCDSPRLRWLWLAPLLFAVWANSHGGFVAALAIFVAYLALRTVEAWWNRGAEAIPLTAQWMVLAALCVLATTLNPYGWNLHRWMIESLGAPRPEIMEWRAPDFQFVWAPLWVMIAVGAVAFAVSRSPRDLTQHIILALVLSQTLAHRRHVAFLAILMGFWSAPHLESLLERLGLARDKRSFGEGVSPNGAKPLLACLVVSSGLVLWLIGGQLSTITVKRSQYPVTAFQFIENEDLRGKLVTRFMWAQYAISTFGSDDPRDGVQVAFDGRFRTCYPQHIVDMYFDFAVGYGGDEPRWRAEDSPPFLAHRLLEYNQPDLVLSDRRQPHATRVMKEQTETWTLLYQDELAQLWGRRTVFDDPTGPRYLAPSRRRVGNQPQTGAVAWPAHPLRKNPTAIFANHSQAIGVVPMTNGNPATKAE